MAQGFINKKLHSYVTDGHIIELDIYVVFQPTKVRRTTGEENNHGLASIILENNSKKKGLLYVYALFSSSLELQNFSY